MSILNNIIGKVWLVDLNTKAEYFSKVKSSSLEISQEEMDKRRANHKKAVSPRFHHPATLPTFAGMKPKKIQYRNEDITIMDTYEIECEDESNDPTYWSADVIGEVRLRGILQKEGGMCVDGTAESLENLNYMGQHPRVKGVLLNIDSPGGEVAGTEEFAKAIANFRTNYSKPIFAYISDCGNSAAYWLASQCDKIYLSGQNAKVGSIGTMICLLDDRKMMDEMGVSIIEINATDSFNKNEAYHQALDGNPEPIRKEYLDILNKNFQNAVMSKRGDKMPKDDAQNGVIIQLTGKVFLGQNAVKYGLADAIAANITEVYQELNREAVRMDKAAKQTAAPATAAANNKQQTKFSNSTILDFQMNPLKSVFSIIAKALGLGGATAQTTAANLTPEQETAARLALASLTPEQEATANAALATDFQVDLMQEIAVKAAATQANSFDAKLKAIQEKVTILETQNGLIVAKNTALETQNNDLAKEIHKQKGLPTSTSGDQKGDQNPTITAEGLANTADWVERAKASQEGKTYAKLLAAKTLNQESYAAEIQKLATAMQQKATATK